MKKILLACLFVLVGGYLFADVSKVPPQKRSHLEVLSRKAYKQNGGIVVRPNSQQGTLAIINQQQRVCDEVINAIQQNLTKNQKIAVKVTKADQTIKSNDLLLKSHSNFAIALIDDILSPTMTIAPEERWATVNVAKLAVGLGGKEVKGEFLASRVRKEVLRAFAFLCGGAGSQFEGNLMSSSSVQQLDNYDEFLPLDVIKRAEKYLSGCGVTSLKFTTYHRACIEGWAPAPTNDVQKAIWDKVHAMPSSPIKIKPETKKVTE